DVHLPRNQSHHCHIPGHPKQLNIEPVSKVKPAVFGDPNGQGTGTFGGITYIESRRLAARRGAKGQEQNSTERQSPGFLRRDMNSDNLSLHQVDLFPLLAASSLNFSSSSARYFSFSGKNLLPCGTLMPLR